MTEPGRTLRLFDETLPRRRLLGGHDLDRDRAIEVEVPRAMNDAHPPSAEDVEELVSLPEDPHRAPRIRP